VIYLLDLNALIALAHDAHTSHGDAVRWRTSLPKGSRLATCAVTEIGFLRVTVQARLQPDVTTARTALARHKASVSYVLLADDLGADSLPGYVTKPAEITDGHLLALAKHHGAKLATFDTGIPGAELIS
jgi:uncharacterized protein